MKIQGKEYEPVASRVARFRADHPDWTLTADLISDSEGVVLMRATILDDEGRVISTGYAEEVRGAGRINQSSTIENCETSAWGRCLSAAGYGTGMSVASAEEVQQARETRAQQDADQAEAKAQARLARAKAKFDAMDLDEPRRIAVAAAIEARDLEGLLDIYQAEKAAEAARAIAPGPLRDLALKHLNHAAAPAPAPPADPIPTEWQQQALRP